jgi:hypothetical protein
MTTAKSPPGQLRAQAHTIADTLKRAARGEKIANDPLGKIPASKERGFIDFAIVMDDKILKIQVPWKVIEESTVPQLCDFIFEQMSKEPDE